MRHLCLPKDIGTMCGKVQASRVHDWYDPRRMNAGMGEGHCGLPPCPVTSLKRSAPCSNRFRQSGFSPSRPPDSSLCLVLDKPVNVKKY
jgi:hypothetical protein